ncbi:MAG: iron-sulfur cluster assembly accessory protein [Rhizobacter sp.]|nr:iron-sulfur cluster assembly accessory protein [Chlorobiales bacterium]
MTTATETAPSKITEATEATEEVPLISVSEGAQAQVERLKQQQNLGADYGLRVSVKGGGCSGLSYGLDFDNEERTGDQIFEHRGVKLFVDMKSFLYLAGTRLDFSDGLNGKGFNFVNPNAERTCGCGESFSV